MNWCLDLSWKSLGLKIQSMCAPRQRSRNIYTHVFGYIVAGGNDTGRETEVHVPGFLRNHLKPAP